MTLDYPRAVYLSEKNITAPSRTRLIPWSIHMENFIWGYMQQHDTYKVYRWYDGKDGTPKDQGTGDPIIMCMWPIPITICTRSHSATLI